MSHEPFHLHKVFILLHCSSFPILTCSFHNSARATRRLHIFGYISQSNKYMLQTPLAENNPPPRNQTTKKRWKNKKNKYPYPSNCSADCPSLQLRLSIMHSKRGELRGEAPCSPGREPWAFPGLRSGAALVLQERVSWRGVELTQCWQRTAPERLLPAPRAPPRFPPGSPGSSRPRSTEASKARPP